MRQQSSRRLFCLVAFGVMVTTAAFFVIGAASVVGKPRNVDSTADNALRVHNAIKHGDYATAQKLSEDILALSKIENWRFYPFRDFIVEITNVNNPGFVDDPRFGAHLTDWIARNKNDAIPFLMRAQYYYDQGWSGHDLSSTTPAERHARFRDYMAKALADVDASIRHSDRNPYAYYLKLLILRGGGLSGAMTDAFEEAIAKYPAYYSLYEIYLNALQPGWGGTFEAMYAFVDKHAGAAPEFSPLKFLYLELYRDLLLSAAANCSQYGGDRDKRAQCVASIMGKIVKPDLEKRVLGALELYDHTDRYQFGLAIRGILFGMLRAAGGDVYSGAVLQLAATSMHSDTQLKQQKPGHNDYVIDEAVATSWEQKGFYDNALEKYREALTDAQSGAFPGEEERNLAIAYIYEQLARISGDNLHQYLDMIEYEKAAIAHGMTWDDHYICASHYHLKQYEEAVLTCTDSIYNTGNSYSLYWRAMAYRDSGNSDAALRDFTDVANSAGRFGAYSAIAMSMIYFDRNDYTSALDVLNKYTYLYDPKRVTKNEVAVSFNNRCYAYMQLGDLKKALDDCTNSLRYGSLPDAYRKQQELVKRLGP